MVKEFPPKQGVFPKGRLCRLRHVINELTNEVLLSSRIRRKAKQFVDGLNAGEEKLTEFGDHPDRGYCEFQGGQRPVDECQHFLSWVSVGASRSSKDVPRKTVGGGNCQKDEKNPQRSRFCILSHFISRLQTILL